MSDKWTPEQFLDYLNGLTSDFVIQQIRETLTERGLCIAPAPCTREPVAWEVWWGVGEMTRGSDLFRSREAAQQNADQIKSNTEVRPLYDEPASSSDLTSLRLALGQIVERANKPSAGETELQTKIADMYRIARYALLPLPDGYPRSAASTAEPVARDWKEDASHENGDYTCQCCECGNSFTGHKRRVICKACSNLLKVAAPTTSTEPCPRPFNDDPQDLSADECVKLGHCGCGHVVASPEPDAVSVEISDEDMRDLLASKDVGSGRAKLRRLLSLKSTAALSRPAHGGYPPGLPKDWTPDMAARASWTVFTLANTPPDEWERKAVIYEAMAAFRTPAAARNDRGGPDA